MAIEPHEEPGVAEQFLDGLINNADLRQRYIAAGHDEDQVAGLIAAHTGKDVEPSNLSGIANHLNANRSEDCSNLAQSYPAMNFVVVGSES
jgi:hypothetical protein